MTRYGYARVSTDGQTLDAQQEALKAAGCETVFRETVGGARADRPQLGRLLAQIGSGDVLMVSRLDRLARSTRDLLDILDTLIERGADVRSLGDPWMDTTTAHGRSIQTVLGGLAAFERDLIRARTDEGRARAKARGQHMGRPPSLTPHQRQEALQALAAGTATQADLARRFAVSQSAMSRLASQAGTPPGEPPPRRLDAETERAARAFLKYLGEAYPVVEGIVFGSRARGDHRPDSDADIAVVLRGEPGNRYKAARDLGDAAYDAMVETGIYVSPLPLWESELKRPALFGNPALIESIKREGLRL